MSSHLFTAVLARLKLLTGSDTDVQLARALAVSPQTLSSWKVRDSIPYSLCIDLARQHGCSLDWLLLGERDDRQALQSLDSWQSEMLDRLRELPLQTANRCCCTSKTSNVSVSSSGNCWSCQNAPLRQSKLSPGGASAG